MAEIEPSGFCTLKEYKQTMNRRVQAAELSANALYLALAALREPEIEKKAAFKFPLRLKKVDLGSTSSALVTIFLLDHDLQTMGETIFTMDDGLSTRPNLQELSTGKYVQELYIRDYEEYLPLDPRGDTIQQGLKELDLVTA